MFGYRVTKVYIKELHMNYRFLNELALLWKNKNTVGKWK